MYLTLNFHDEKLKIRAYDVKDKTFESINTQNTIILEDYEAK